MGPSPSSLEVVGRAANAFLKAVHPTAAIPQPEAEQLDRLLELEAEHDPPEEDAPF